MKTKPYSRWILARWFRGRVAAVALIAVLAATLNARAQFYAHDDSYRDFVLANTEFTLVHELGHVIIRELNVPILGKEEDAVDHMAVVSLLIFHGMQTREDLAEWLLSIADAWRLEWQLANEDNLDISYFDLHSLEIQRFYDTVCLVYGSAPENLSYLVSEMGLPSDRARFCEEEYDMARNGVAWVMRDFGVKRDAEGNRLSGTLSVEYEPATSLNGERLVRWLNESQIVENVIARFEANFTIPRDIKIVFAKCGVNGYWDEETAEIVMCYGLLERFIYLAEIRRQRIEAALAQGADDDRADAAKASVDAPPNRAWWR